MHISVGCSALVVALAVCSAPPVEAARRTSVPDKTALQARADEMCAAWVKMDWQTWYTLLVPGAADCMSVDEWAKGLRTQGVAAINSCRIVAVRGANKPDLEGLRKPCSGAPQQFAGAAEIVVKLEVTSDEGKRSRISDMLHAWLYIDGQWYWYGLGSSSFHDCD